MAALVVGGVGGGPPSTRKAAMAAFGRVGRAVGGADPARAVLLRLGRQPGTPLSAPPRGLAEPRVGEPFIATAGRPAGEVLAVTPGRELTGSILGAVMSYRVEPIAAGSSRLVLTLVMRRGRIIAPLVCVGDLVMARRQLLTWKSLAEAGSA